MDLTQLFSFDNITTGHIIYFAYVFVVTSLTLSISTLLTTNEFFDKYTIVKLLTRVVIIFNMFTFAQSFGEEYFPQYNTIVNWTLCLVSTLIIQIVYGRQAVKFEEQRMNTKLFLMDTYFFPVIKMNYYFFVILLMCGNAYVTMGKMVNLMQHLQFRHTCRRMNFIYILYYDLIFNASIQLFSGLRDGNSRKLFLLCSIGGEPSVGLTDNHEEFLKRVKIIEKQIRPSLLARIETEDYM